MKSNRLLNLSPTMKIYDKLCIILLRKWEIKIDNLMNLCRSEYTHKIEFVLYESIEERSCFKRSFDPNSYFISYKSLLHTVTL